MPLLLITGYPSSGKSTLASTIWNKLKEDYGISSTLLRDTDYSFIPSHTPSNVSEEKIVRSSLIGAAERILNGTSCVIVDASHEIKGWRYQMHCIAKAASTPHLLVHCATPMDECLAWNKERIEVQDRYEEESLRQLVSRYELPNCSNRWDSPLITVDVTLGDAGLPMQQIYDYLFKSAPPVPNMATARKPTVAVGYPAMLDKVTTSVLSCIQAVQVSHGNIRNIKGSSDWPISLSLSRPLGQAEGQRIRRQFIQMLSTRSQNILEEAHILSAFLDYLSVTIN